MPVANEPLELSMFIILAGVRLAILMASNNGTLASFIILATNLSAVVTLPANALVVVGEFGKKYVYDNNRQAILFTA